MLIFLIYLIFQKIYKNHFSEKYKNLNLHQKDLAFNFQVLSSNYDNLHYQNILKIDVKNLISKLNINKKKSSFLLYKDYLLNLIPINFHFLKFNLKSINHQRLIFNKINYIYKYNYFSLFNVLFVNNDLFIAANPSKFILFLEKFISYKFFKDIIIFSI